MKTEAEQPARTPAGAMMWVVTGGVLLIGTLAVVSYGNSEEAQAASGAPLYDFAVKEAIRGLVELGGKKQVGVRPPLPAGLSAKDHYWCENCKAWHKREAADTPQAPKVAGTPAAPGTTPPNAQAIPPLAAGLSPDEHYWCANCKAWHKHEANAAPHGPNGASPPASGAIPPLAAGLSPDEHYWCANCKSWHKRDAKTEPHGQDGASPPAPGTIPPLAAGLSPDEHYWCANCKSWHKNEAKAAPHGQDGASTPASGAIPPLPEGLSPNDYYWCADCKSYHKSEAKSAPHPDESAPAVPSPTPVPVPTPAPAPAEPKPTPEVTP